MRDVRTAVMDQRARAKQQAKQAESAFEGAARERREAAKVDAPRSSASKSGVSAPAIRRGAVRRDRPPVPMQSERAMCVVAREIR